MLSTAALGESRFQAQRVQVRRRTNVSVGLAVVTCAVLRVWLLLSDHALFDGDEAAVGVAADGFRHGQLRAFFPGQHYGGTLEIVAQAAVGWLLPRNPFTLRLALVGFAALTCWLVYRCALRMGSPRAAVLACWLFAIWPWFSIIGSTTALGFYVAGQALAMLTLLAALRLREVPTFGRAWAVGLSAGLAVWNSPTSLYIVAPALLWIAPQLLPRAPNRWPVRLGVSTGLALGCAPVLALLLLRGEVALPTGRPALVIGPVQRLKNLFGPILRESLGLAYSYDRPALPLWLAEVVSLLVVAGVAVLIWQRRARLWRLVTLRAGELPSEILLLVPLVVIALYAASPNAWFIDNPRYVFSAYPALVIGVALVITRLSRWRSLRPGTTAVLSVVVLALAATSSLGYLWGPSTSQDLVDTRPVYLAATDLLVKRNEVVVYADYWTGMPLQYFADSRLTVAVSSGSQRFPRMQRIAAEDPEVVYVGNAKDGTATRLAKALATQNVTYRRTAVGFIVVFDHLSRAIRPCQLGIGPC